MDFNIKYSRMEKKLRFNRIVSVSFAVVTLVFVCLFSYSMDKTHKEYSDIYLASVSNSAAIVEAMSKDNFDYETKYIEVVSELNVCTKMVSLAGFDQNAQKAMNEIYYSFIKLPNQVRPNLSVLSASLQKIASDDMAGYDEIIKLVAGFDKQDY